MKITWINNICSILKSSPILEFENNKIKKLRMLTKKENIKHIKAHYLSIWEWDQKISMFIDCIENEEQVTWKSCPLCEKYWKPTNKFMP